MDQTQVKKAMRMVEDGEITLTDADENDRVGFQEAQKKLETASRNIVMKSSLAV